MKNITPRNYWQLVEIARHSFRALQTWEVELAITHSTGARLQSDWEGVVQTQDDYQTSKSVYHETVKAKVAAQRRAFKLLMVTRDLLRQDLGTHYSRLWDQVGFFNCTLKIPVLAKQQIAKLSSLKEFFLLNPAAEVAGVASAAQAAAMHEELSERVGEVATARRVQRQRKIERNAAVAALRQRVKQLYAELKIVLPLDDPRWLEFGFNIPTAPSIPAPPEDLTIAPVTEDESELKWKRSPTATHYRVYHQIVGRDAEYVYLESARDTSLRVKRPPVDAHEGFQITAVNEAGESVPSGVIEFPPAATPT